MATSSDHLGRPCSDSSSWLHHHLLSIENDPLMMISSSAAAAAPQMITRSVQLPPTDPQHENETSSSSATLRPLKRKKKSRSSSSRKNSLTTFIAADPANFRHMVQQITGGNAAPILKPAPQRPAAGLMPAPHSPDHGGGFQAGFLPCFPVLESHVNISALVSSSTYFTG